ncbi:M20/M25/M40 family metallo-hydrolase [Terrilactibacillus laevilacticus]|uniref:M20/M25/M40 family metallo-hydrolase n=1 Tax=Terrilactibacillus laevilacticus TaxID=1380157 RepID=A0ABW5PMY7_9BACI|nr:M20/M25/M40 family metallo-hydrolase [Terrilactibacillus laevilacticus]
MDLLSKDLTEEERIEKLTTWLVNMPSVNGTPNEAGIADQIAALIKQFPYFTHHPTQVWLHQIPNDPLSRKNVFAFVRGPKQTKQTVIFHSHMDTVGVKDFGKLEEHAFDPAALLDYFKTYTGDDTIREQALSGDWMFGRGALDMKSGLAVHLSNLLYYSEHPDRLIGNILLMVNPIEETSHGGIIAATEELLRIKETLSLDYVAAINNDYTSAFYPGDPARYIYTGAVGKCLPSFYVYGRETHVGETLKGLDPTFVTSELNRQINNNMSLAENLEGEMILPPCTLLNREIKDHYNVQTPITSFIYFNYMIYERPPEDIMNQLKTIAYNVRDMTKKYYEAQYEAFLKRNGLPSRMLTWDLAVYTYEEFCEKLGGQGVNVKALAEKIHLEYQKEDIRTITYHIVDELRKHDQTMQPCIIIFFGPPYVPYTFIEGEKQILNIIHEEAERFGKETGETFSIKRFFPYLSDSSYLSLIDLKNSLEVLTKNFPEWDSLGQVPFDHLRKLDIPSINLGVYGMDAHKWTERVYKPYTFHKLPKLTRRLTSAFLKIEG